MLLANSEIVGILPHTTRIESPEIRIPLPSNPQPLTLKMGQRQFANNIYSEDTPSGVVRPLPLVPPPLRCTTSVPPTRPARTDDRRDCVASYVVWLTVRR